MEQGIHFVGFTGSGKKKYELEEDGQLTILTEVLYSEEIIELNVGNYLNYLSKGHPYNYMYAEFNLGIRGLYEDLSGRKGFVYFYLVRLAPLIKSNNFVDCYHQEEPIYFEYKL